MKAPFEFEKARDFGAIVGDSLQFFARNFKAFLLGFLTYVGPFLLIGMIAMISLGKQLLGFFVNPESTAMFPMSAVFLVPAVLAATIMVFVFVTAAIQKYQRAPEEALMTGIWPDIRKNIAPAVIAMLFVLLLVGVSSALLFTVAATTGVAGLVVMVFLWLPAFIYILVPLSIFIVLHVLEKNPIGVSLKRAFQLVKGNWWSTFFIYIIISLLAGIASYIFVVPAYIVLMIKSIGAIDSGILNQETGVWFGITYACAFLGSSFTSMYQILGITLQYFSLREQKEGIGLLRRIEALDQPDIGKYV